MAELRELQNIPSFLDERADNPNDVDSFVAWLSKYYGYDHRRYENYYRLAVDDLERGLKESEFWSGIHAFLLDVNAEYQEQRGNMLLEKTDPPILYKKSLNSVIQKAYRKDVLNNKDFPDEPKDKGWILPDNWFSSLNDIIRTTIIVRYLDGVEFLLQRLKEYAESKGCGFTFDYEARENGYYAAHTGVQLELSFPNYNDLEPTPITISLEIQITTQLQSIIKDLLHSYYEADRIKEVDNSYKWQWDYKSDRFNTNYLGHMVHFIEGMVVDMRDKQHQQE